MAKVENIQEEYPMISIEVPMLNLNRDSEKVLIEFDKAVKDYQKRYYESLYNGGSIYNAYLDDDDNWDDDDYGMDTEGWKSYFNGFGMTNDEWDEWQRSIDEYEAELKRFEGISGHSIRNKAEKSKKKISPQRFINGIEVDDDEWNEYNNKNVKHTRRGGRKHKGNRTIQIINGVRVESSPNKKRKTRYIDDEWNERHINDSFTYPSVHECNSSKALKEELKNEEKKIVFYRNLPDEQDTYEWDNLYEFSEWLGENNIEVDDNVAYDIMYAQEVHCCLNPDTTSKELIMSQSYDDLKYNATSGDLSMLEDPTNHWNYHGI